MSNEERYKNFRDHTVVSSIFKQGERAKIESTIVRAQHMHTSKLGSEEHMVRNSDVSWIYPDSETQWLFDRLNGVMEDVNKNNYGYDISEGYNAIQVTEYTPGQFYDWHMDYGPGEYFTRKLSMSVQISDPREYEGGELHFFRDGVHTNTAPKDFGTGVIFPSWVQHKAGEVTKGFRRSLVAWYLGPPWK